MGQIDKLISRFLMKPKDFTWRELLKLLSELGYEQTQSGKTSGSRVRFTHKLFEPICLHKPHPRSVLKAYQIRQLMNVLKERGQI